MADMSGGRPPVYTDDDKMRVCELVAQGYSLRSIQRMEGMPERHTVVRWTLEDPEFSAQYARAKLMQAWLLADDIIDISDDSTNDYVEREGATGERTIVFDAENLARSRLRVDSRKWYLSKVLPKTFGDKQLPTGSGNVTVQLVDVSAMKIEKPTKETDGG